MARRKDYTRPFVVFAGAALLVGSIAATYKILGTRPAPANANASAQPNPLVTQTPAFEPPRPVEIKSPLAGVESKPEPATQPALLSNPATQPTPLQAAQAMPAPRPADGGPLFREIDAKIKADDLIGARNLLVSLIDTGTLSSADKDEALRRLSQVNETVIFSPRKFNSDQHALQHVVKPGETMQKIARNYDITWQFIGRLNGISDPRRLQAGKSLKIIKGPFHAYVNKKDFTLDVYIGKPNQPGSVFIKRFRVGLGEHDSTPTGVWLVTNKLENPRYYNPRSDGPRIIEPDDPKNPLGERWIALEGQEGQAVGKTSYGIHGTIEPESIGQMKSMGCIRMLNEDVELVYDLLIPGKSTVTVVE